MTYFCLTSATLVILFSVQTLAQTVVSYKSEIQLPMDMYTAEGALLKKGNFDLEVRFERGHYSLVFLDKDKIIAPVNGQTVGKESEESKDPHPSIPLLGTILLLPNTPVEKGKGTAVAVAPRLPNLSWKATLRVYKSPNPNDKEVRFIFQERENPGQEVLVHFRLFLKKLA